jgi:hypothetical protein
MATLSRSAHVRPLIWLAIMLLAGCGSDRDYDAAVRTNSVAAFDDYLRLHPDGTHAAEVRGRLVALVEDREWQRARAANTSDAYQQYLRSYATGAHAHDALVAIADLNMATPANAEAPPAAVPADTGAPVAKGPILREPPRPAAPAVARAPVPTAPARAAVIPVPAAPVATGGDVRIQLGAFGAELAAADAWQRLRARHAELAGHEPVLVATQTADGRHFQRLQVGGFTRASAAATCAALVTAHDACFVTLATGGSPP